MICLGIDSSSVAGSAAVIRDGVLVSEIFGNIGLTHSETLAPSVDRALQTAGIGISDVDLIAVTCGPGSFTGIRIGVALAKGLAFPGNTPAVGILSTDALAYPFAGFDGIVIAALDARRNRVFYNAYNRGSAIQAVGITEIDALAAVIGEQRCLLVGDGAELCYNHLKDTCSVQTEPVSLTNIRASFVAELGLARFRELGAGSAADLRPVYIQMSQAERTLKEKLQHPEK